MVTSYYIDEKSTGLAALQKRLQTSDLIPSQEPLLDGLSAKMGALRAAGVNSVADLRVALKSPKSLTSLSKETEIKPDYLRLLRRTVNGFFPKPRPLGDMDWLGSDLVMSLKSAGIRNTKDVFEATCDGASALAQKIGADAEDLIELAAVSDLCRIQWVSPRYARALFATGHTNAAAVARADPEALSQAIATANRNARFYKGKVGLRDVGRLVAAASYVP